MSWPGDGDVGVKTVIATAEARTLCSQNPTPLVHAAREANTGSWDCWSLSLLLLHSRGLGIAGWGLQRDVYSADSKATGFCFTHRAQYSWT